MPKPRGSAFAVDAHRAWDGPTSSTLKWTTDQPDGRQLTIEWLQSGDSKVVHVGVTLIGDGHHQGMDYEVAFANAHFDWHREESAHDGKLEGPKPT